jgi:hypothetical protein
MLTARIGQYDRDPDPYFAERDYDVHLIPEALKCVAFLGIKKGGKFLPRATCFFVQYTEFGHSFCHLVTAEHVVSGLLSKGHDLWLRVNVYGKKGAMTFAIPDAGKVFRFHPNNENEATDVAICPCAPQFQDEETGETVHIAMRALRLDADAEDGFLPRGDFAEKRIGLGAEIAIIGLFRSHYGTNQNIPIVRVGNIAAMPGEPVHTDYAGYIKAYLIEARSIAGLSGSPVLIFPDSAVILAEGIAKRRIDQQGCALLGLMHGHFDVPNLNEDVVADEDAPERGVHTGIGVVVPVEKIVETLRHPDLTAMRKETAERLRKEKGATADIITDDVAASAAPPANDENPKHREDFNSLVGAAARKLARED